MDITQYPHSFLTFERLHVHVKGLYVKVPCIQHSIRRVEFDAWLLERVRRAGRPAHGEEHPRWKMAGTSSTRRIARGISSAPAARAARSIARCFARRILARWSLQTVTLEHEIPYDWKDGDCHLWFFDKGLPGYSWYVPKKNGFLNVGVGGMAERMKRSGKDIRYHWAHITGLLDRKLASGAQYDPHGYSYYLRGNVDVRAHRECVHHGRCRRARDSRHGGRASGRPFAAGNGLLMPILHGAEYQLHDVTGGSLGGGLVTRLFDWAMTARR